MSFFFYQTKYTKLQMSLHYSVQSSAAAAMLKVVVLGAGAVI